MPTPKKPFPSVQLQSYITEPRAHGSVPPFIVVATDEAVTSKEAGMKECLAVWEENWKRLGTIRYVPTDLCAFFRAIGLITAEIIFGVLSDPAVGDLEVLHQHSASRTCYRG